MKRKLQIMHDLFEIVQSYEPYIKIAIQENKLSYFDNLKALCHWHDDIEIIYILKGKMNFYVNGKNILIHEHDGLIINSKQMHYGYSEQGLDCEFICILIHPIIFNYNNDFFNHFVKTIISNNQIEYLYLNNNNLNDHHLLLLFNKLLLLYKSSISEKEILYYSIIFKIWHKFYTILKKNFNLSELNSSNISNDLIIQKNMTAYIYKNYTQNISLNDIAESGNICRSKCCKLFKKYLNQTPIDFLNTYRLEISKSLLINSNLNITKIALNSGFNHLSYFSKLFYQKYNFTPKEYRKLNKNR